MLSLRYQLDDSRSNHTECLRFETSKTIKSSIPFYCSIRIYLPLYARVLAIVSVLVILATPLAFADHAQIQISIQMCDDKLCFVPDVVTIDQGSEIVWINNDHQEHDINSGTASNPSDMFASVTLQPGQTYSVFFRELGEYGFYGDEGALTGHIVVEGGDHHDDPLDVFAIGALYPFSDDADLGIAADIAVSDFNEYLAESGMSWRLAVSHMDTSGGTIQALEKTNAQKISLVTGLPNIENDAVEYANSNGLLLLSCCSDADNLAIPDDNLYRLMPNHANQGMALSRLLHDAGITYAIPIWQDDDAGRSIYNSVSADFVARGGEIDKGISYGSDERAVTYMDTLVQRVADNISDERDMAIVSVTFDQTSELLEAASQHDELADVMWFGSADIAATAPSGSIEFTTVSGMVDPGLKFSQVKQAIQDQTAREPGLDEYTMYDSVWLLGKSIMQAGDRTDIDTIKEVLPGVASQHNGALGSVPLNDAGDTTHANYRVYKSTGDGWSATSVYLGRLDVLATDSTLAGNVTVGAVYSLSGPFATSGNQNLAATRMGADDFNAFLDNAGIKDWRMHIIPEDTQSSRDVVLDGIKNLHDVGINITIGPSSSSDIHEIKDYTDSENMLVLSCCSTAPSLSIENDSIFRLAPDDNYQALAISRLLVSEGFEVMVPVWSDEPYGIGLAESASREFESRGGVAVEGISYDRDMPDYTGMASTLDDIMQPLYDTHDKSKIAVYLVSPNESVGIFTAASAHHTLDDIRWFGAESITKESILVENATANQFARSVDFTSLQITESRGDAYHSVQSRLYDILGYDPPTFAYQAYDSSWLIGLSILQAGTTDVPQVTDSIGGVAAAYVGTIGNTDLNSAGDLAAADYGIWGLNDDGWTELGQYLSESDSILLYLPSDAPDESHDHHDHEH